MRYFQNTRNRTLSLSNPNVAVGPGQVKAFSDEIVQNSATISSALGSGFLVEVKEGTPALDFKIAYKNNGNAVISDTDTPERIILNDGVYNPGGKPTAQALNRVQQPGTKPAAPVTPVAKPAAKPEVKVEEATIIVKGNKPGEGVEKGLNEVLQDNVKAVTLSNDNQCVVSAAPVMPAAPVKIDVPKDMESWMKYNPLEKKIQIIRMNDVDQLTYIGSYDTDATVQKLIAQRIAELRG